MMTRFFHSFIDFDDRAELTQSSKAFDSSSRNSVSTV